MKTGLQIKIAVAAMFALLLCSIPAGCLASELTLRAYRGNWSTQERPGYWLVNLEFNHTVFADDLKKAIKVTLDRGDERFELLDSQEHREASGAAKKFRLGQRTIPVTRVWLLYRYEEIVGLAVFAPEF
jgi:hypothetical protein